MEDLARWLDRAKAGDREAYRELYRGYRKPVLRFLLSSTDLEPDDAEDVVQETFVRAFRHLHSLKSPGAFESWLLSIARNRARTLRERNQFRTLVRELFAAEPVPESEDGIGVLLEQERREKIVRELIRELPEGDERTTLELFYIDGGLTAREIGLRLGVAKTTVTSRLERFRLRIRRELIRRLIDGEGEVGP